MLSKRADVLSSRMFSVMGKVPKPPMSQFLSLQQELRTMVTSK